MTTNARSGPPKDRPVAPAPPPPPSWRRWLIPLGIALTLVLLFVPMGSRPTEVDYGTLVQQVEDKHVETLELTADGAISGTYRSGFHGGDDFTSHYPSGLQGVDTAFLDRVRDPAYVPHFHPSGASGSWLSTLLSFLPLLLFLGFFLYMGRAARRGLAGGLGGIPGIGGSKAKVIDADRPSTTFADVAGYEGVKRDVAEVVDFLRRPERYAAAGAVAPRGVLMAGPPGTGKTLLARAVAGEASVPFFPITGSGFVELFVGVGASRVRDLFAEARKRAPAIIFIDEIDAIGQRRGAGLSTNDEREQTLNQLLAEMDGFDPAHGVVVLAATNRPDTLDPALLRPGRFDRQVAIPPPTQAERRAILEVHCRTKRSGPDVDLGTLARATPGFSGADLANLANEAAIVAVRDDRVVLCAADFETALDRIVLGRRERGNVLLAEERHRVAIHEAGHAVVAAFSAQADPVSKISILPAGNALGVTHQLPIDERPLYTEAYLRDALAVRLAGRVAEELLSGGRSSGAADDLASATRLAERMVRELGLSEELGPRAYP